MSKLCQTARHFKHGMSGSSEYWIWRGIVKRCTKPNNDHYAEYGGRGITICDEWLDFEVFYKDMGKRPSKQHSVDRVDNNGNYCPDNCRWTTHDVQMNNRRSNVLITAYGVTQNITQWAKTLEIPPIRIFGRLNRGWNEHDALFTPKLQEYKR